MNILAIIPARSGSKSVPNKNIRLIAGKPMLAYSIEHAKGSKYINRIVVSTDSEEYAKIGQQYGAEVPFIRPKEYAQDESLDIEVFYHCLKYLEEKENYSPDIVVQLRPTYPIRNPIDIDNMIEMLLNTKEADSVRSIAPAKELAYKMWFKDKNDFINPILTDIPEAYNMPRQKLPAIYYQNACIDVTRGKTIIDNYSMTGINIMGYVMEKNYDIDTEEEFRKAEEYLKIISGGNRFVFDIDGVIANLVPDNNYSLATPNVRIIDVINRLYSMDNYIVLLTARGYATGIDWKDTTVKQMKEWGVSYHELHFGKPNADFYIDDKMMDLNKLLTMFN
ncbi:hypothetical protein Ana3638_07750 [Anaerocolumna sedimenticola]|uniref:N-acylneuraminate cytidylyltransferase n=1 Tax=Anaerocolumna sedimenticola TaxID=2696063 RepID=A0A6P1TMW3_9FIRM|nr:acylneuraminate cytidylyltransferase family protein [Anaerocolumna sedimenticola]QHQ60678.1 hypothetical protein Ana3638_07750 [Anaerocolumna sedimenticola]